MSSANLMRLLPIKEYLRSKFVTVSDQWITNKLNVNTNSSNEGIYQMWLNSDLTKISGNDCISSLPSDCNQIKFDEQNQKAEKITLYGKYALQINSIEDISRPKILSAADALEEDLNSSDDNSEPEIENNTKLFKKNKKRPKEKAATKRGPRMLSMELSDGRTHCKAIEYKAIDALSLQTPIGTKLLISGPFDIYSAVIFLTPRHVTLLGGSIPIENNSTGTNDRPLRTLFPQTN